MHPEASSHVIFGWSAAWVSSVLFCIVYGLIISEKINRAVVGLAGAGLLILCGVLTQEAALRGIDFNTIGLLLGMMLIVGITSKSGIFQYVAIWSAKAVNAAPVGVLIMLSLVTAVLSALLDNVTTVLLIVPVTLAITEELGVKAYPYLINEVLFSNIGGTATLIGDPPNIMIGSAVGLTFMDFVIHAGPAVLLVMVLTILPMYWIWRKDLVATPEAQQRVMCFNEREAIKDSRLLKQALGVLAGVIAGFVVAHHFHIAPATISMFGAAVLLLLDNFGRSADDQSKNVHHAFSEVEWITLMFFVGLFILVHGLEASGVIRALAEQLLAVTGGDQKITALGILWGSALLSGVIDNIPFVATMIPLIKSLAPVFGGEQELMKFWWALSLGACLGGNGTLVGASANLVVAGLAERAGQPIRFWDYTKSCFPLMLLSIAVCHLYLQLRYL
ncbi:MAG: ArsB/NhaD family transporter [Bryobacteraceae bacterium]|nr:ArsB/NhaD family transporter [Bryobacteraceae bacterium]MDW8377059.1 ArsB/NhaD family transporter [Bryobacterales bacterium]